MKAILVVDMPENCLECELWKYGNKHGIVCRQPSDGYKKPEWCSLQPINKVVKAGNRDLIIYDRDYLYKNFDREIEFMRSTKEFYESNINS